MGYLKFVAQPLWAVWNRFVSPKRDTEQQANVKTNLCVALVLLEDFSVLLTMIMLVEPLGLTPFLV